jgi:hypothetical protein
MKVVGGDPRRSKDSSRVHVIRVPGGQPKVSDLAKLFRERGFQNGKQGYGFIPVHELDSKDAAQAGLGPIRGVVSTAIRILLESKLRV